MKLDRNTNPDGRGKYALIKLRENPILGAMPPAPGHRQASVIADDGIDFGDTQEGEFFVILLKDKFAASALIAYTQAARADDPEYADEILTLADKANNHPLRRMPD